MDRTPDQTKLCPVTPVATGDPAASLAAAFAQFNTTSAQLAQSYGALEAEASRLNRELAAAHHKHELEQAREAQRLAALMDALPGGVLLLDGNEKVTEASSAAVDFLGEPLRGELWQDLRKRCFADGPDAHGDFGLLDGRRVNLAQKSLQPGPGRVLLLTDITGKRKIENLLARHQRLAAMGEMAAALAHQIRTPLAAGLLYASNARRTNLPAAQRDSLLEKSISCLHDLEHLIADMLQFARGATLEENRFSLAELLEHVETSLRAVVRPGQELVIARPAQDIPLSGNRETLAGALINLATNALHAAGSTAEVRIFTRCSRLQAEILVTDNGPGVGEKLRQRIFEPFFTSRSDGTGLGLAVARSIARAHRGDVVLLDGTPGRTTFSLRLPGVPAGSGQTRTAGTVAA